MSEREQIKADIARELERDGVAVIIDNTPLKVWIAPVEVEPSEQWNLLVTLVDIFHLPGALDERWCDSVLSICLAAEGGDGLSPIEGISHTPHRWRVIHHRRAGATIRLRLERYSG